LQLAKLQEPAAHVGPVTLAGLHGVPQTPQFVSEVSDASQPSETVPLQLPQFGLHDNSTHEPVEQDSLALDRSHADPHVPQLDSVVSDVSQPFVVLPSQLPQVGLHAISAHEPVVHDSVALARSHATPQLPQSVSVVSDRSHPSEPLPLQLPHPPTHPEKAHAPVMHVAPVAFAGLHGTPHAPQFKSVVSVASQPSASELLQSPHGVSQLEIRQTPVEQDSLARARSHGTPHAPQFSSVVSCVSHPLLRMPSQSPQLRLQLGEHCPATHVAVSACGIALHTAPPSVAPSQLSSAPLHASIAPGCTSGSRSSQSVPLHAASA
jgi:hypothetical protein